MVVTRSWRRRLSTLAAAVSITLLGCEVGDVGPQPEPEDLVPTTWVDPQRRLGNLLERGSRPGELEVVERLEVEALVGRLLPPLGDDHTGGWKVVYYDMPGADLITVELLTSEEPFGPRSLWLRWIYWPEGAPERCVGEPVSGHPACEVDRHHLTVQAGRVEIMLVPEAEEWRAPGALRELAASMPLEAIAAL